MIKVLIIDDEEVVRNGLKKYISWESLGISETRISYVYTADGAETAQFQCYHPGQRKSQHESHFKKPWAFQSGFYQYCISRASATGL